MRQATDLQARGGNRRRPAGCTGLLGLLLAGVLLGLGGCASLTATQTAALRSQAPAGLSPTAELANTPFFPQTAYHCGPAALATALGAAGFSRQPEALGPEVFLPSRQGSLQTEMLGATRREGAVATRIPGTLDALLREVAAGHPVVVLQNLGLDLVPVWHYAVVIGYRLPAAGAAGGSGELLLRSGTVERQQMAMATFEHTWKRAGFWGFVVLPPGRWPATATESAVVDAALGFERAASPADALRSYTSAHRRWPNNLTLAMGLGNSAYASGNKLLAVEMFRSTAEQHQNTAAWINLARTLLELKQPQAAWQAAKQAVALPDPTWAQQADQVLDDSARAVLASQAGRSAASALLRKDGPSAPPAKRPAVKRNKASRQATPVR